jgi:hypothetical protein
MENRCGKPPGKLPRNAFVPVRFAFFARRKVKRARVSAPRFWWSRVVLAAFNRGEGAPAPASMCYKRTTRPPGEVAGYATEALA